MLDRPPISDAAIIGTVGAAFEIDVARVSFLALGHDADAWTFRADIDGRDSLFLKIRRTADDARLAACRFMFEGGNDAVVAPLRTGSGDLSTSIGDLSLMAYPFVEADSAADGGLTDEQWVAYGALVARVHGTELPAEMERALPHETFMPGAIADVERIEAAIAEADGNTPRDQVRRELAELWQTHQPEIRAIAERTAGLAEKNRTLLAEGGSHPFVACHGDIHTHNLLVDEAGSLRVVDWDEIVIAPVERDLMFVLGSPIGLRRGKRETDLFRRGYGPMDVDAERLAYYHADWAIQDLVGYADETLASEASPASREAALATFRSLFDPDDEVQVAQRALDTAAEPPAGPSLERTRRAGRMV